MDVIVLVSAMFCVCIPAIGILMACPMMADQNMEHKR